MKEVAGDTIGLALDCGPGWMLSDAIRLARMLEPYNLLWIEDLLTGDYTPWVNAGVYRELTRVSTTPIHTGEQIYLRQNFKELIETQAVNVLGPDPADVGGIAELKWIAEYADLHSILFAPHGTANGLLGLAALIQVSATLPANFIAFEYTTGDPDWWYGHRRRTAGGDRQERLHRCHRPSRHGRRSHPGKGQALSRRGRPRLFRLIFRPCSQGKAERAVQKPPSRLSTFKGGFSANFNPDQSLTGCVIASENMCLKMSFGWKPKTHPISFDIPLASFIVILVSVFA